MLGPAEVTFFNNPNTEITCSIRQTMCQSSKQMCTQSLEMDAPSQILTRTQRVTVIMVGQNAAGYTDGSFMQRCIHTCIWARVVSLDTGFL